MNNYHKTKKDKENINKKTKKQQNIYFKKANMFGVAPGDLLAPSRDHLGALRQSWCYLEAFLGELGVIRSYFKSSDTVQGGSTQINK